MNLRIMLLICGALIFVIAIELMVLTGIPLPLPRSPQVLRLAETTPPSESERTAFAAFWGERIAVHGPENTYEEFRAYYQHRTNGTEHIAAHRFGELLYERLGLAGAAVCDDSFSFGCFHSFLGTAIHNHGLGIINELNRICIERLGPQSLGCQHGIGHGIAASLGYEPNDLRTALRICAELPVNDPIGGCIGGVFMEYNFRTMLDELATLREFDPADPHAPCSELSDEIMIACYHWQPQWWANVLTGDLEKKYATIADFCTEIHDQAAREQCWIGAGDAAGQLADWNSEVVLRLCRILGSSAADYACRIGAAGAFFAEARQRDHAEVFCNDPDQNRRDTCIARMRFDTEAPVMPRSTND